MIRGTPESGVTPMIPASCSAPTPLPARTTASTAMRIALHWKNWVIGSLRLNRSIAQAIAASKAAAVSAPARMVPPLSDVHSAA